MRANFGGPFRNVRGAGGAVVAHGRKQCCGGNSDAFP